MIFEVLKRKDPKKKMLKIVFVLLKVVIEIVLNIPLPWIEDIKHSNY